MARGKKAEIGDVRWSQNGYKYIRTEEGWELAHRLIVEKELGRPLEDDERVRFVDGDRTNLAPENLEVFKIKRPTKEAQRARIESKIEDLKAQLDELAEST